MASSHDDVPRVIKRELPNAVTYNLSHPDSVTITLPSGSTWSSGLHWHAAHTEYLKVLQGSIQVRLNDVTQTIAASPESQPEIKVDRYAWHEWRRAHTDDGVEVVVVERTDPVDGEKAVFFWNINGVILNAPKLPQVAHRLGSVPGLRAKVDDLWIFLNLFNIFYHLDNIPVLYSLSEILSPHSNFHWFFKILDYLLNRLFLYAVAAIGKAFGIRPVRLKYTPPVEFAQWIDRNT